VQTESPCERQLDEGYCPEEIFAARWQFGLRHIFGLTTLTAIAAALVAAFGPGTMVLSLGVVITWLNVCGAFQALQNGRRRAAVLWLAWTVFLISLALPSIKIFGPVSGFSAAWFALQAPPGMLFDPQGQPIAAIVYAVLDIANALMLVMPALIWRLSRGRGRLLGIALCLVMVGPWCLAWNPEGFLVGYYIWCASFGLALIGVRISGRTLMGMMAAAAVLAAVVAYWQ
jgi:hypothetical protein